MDRFGYVFELHRILKSHRYPVPRQVLEQRMECKTKTIERTIKYMRDSLHAPIEYDREANGYHYAAGPDGPYELPGLWFNAAELAALCVLDQLLGRIEPGLLADELAPARRRIKQLIEHENLGLAHLRERVRILDMGNRQPGSAFAVCAEAVLRQRRMNFAYHSRSKNQTTNRTVSPQRLTHYRDNWYLDAFCHTVEALRTFAVDRVQDAHCLDEPAMLLDDATLDQTLAQTYGIFAGPVQHTAVLIFSAERARWVADETWHPEQNGHYLPDGRYQLEIPYGDDRELLGDILRYGPHVVVQAPDSLRQKLQTAIAALQHLYE